MFVFTPARTFVLALLPACAGSTFKPLEPPESGTVPGSNDSGQGTDPTVTDSGQDTDSGTDSGSPPRDEWFESSACEENALRYVGHEESCLFNSFAWISPDDGGIVVRAAMTEPGGPTACELFSTDPSPYELQPLVINIWAGEGNELGAHEVTMEAAKEEAPPPGDPNEPDGLGADAVVRLASGDRLRSESMGEVFEILHYGATDPLVVDDRFQVTFNDGSILEAGDWVACYCPGMVAFGSE